MDKRTLQRLRVPLGFAFGAAFLVFARPLPETLIIGAAIAVIGLAIRAWSAGHIRKNLELATTGPYAHTRNPLYLGSFIMGLGCVAAAGVWWLAIIFVILFCAIYFPVMSAESDELIDTFGNDFKLYSENVPLFFPRFSAYKNSHLSGNEFDANLYLKYREYRAALGLVLVWCILWAKAYFFGS